MEDGRIKRGTRGRGRGKRGSRGRGRGKKESYISDEESSTINLNESKVEVVQPSENVVEIEENIPPMPAVEEPAPAQIPPTLGMEDDISQLEAPTFTTLVRAPPEPMLHLKWNHKVNLIGEKVLNPMIYNCDQCDKPILVYGRMIPCKHVFCLKCARSEPHLKMCPRCKEKVVRVEQSSLGTVYMCMHGGSRYGNTGCRRTYLSQRDLQAHINHRHVTQQPDLPKPSEIPQQRKISESSSSVQLPVSRQTLSKQIQIAPLTTSNLTRANLATLNEQQQKSTHLHPHVHETVADASYYSNALSNYGSQVNNPSQYTQIPSAASNPSQPAPPSQFYSPFAQPQNFSGAVPPQNFHGTSNPNQWNPSQHQQYYR